MYQRVLLKLSGEQLAGKYDGGFDVELAAWVSKEVKEVVNAGCEVVIMVGGGNYARGAQLAGHGINRVTADNIGMLATIMNAIALADVFNAHDVSTRAVSNIVTEHVIDPFTHRRAVSHLHKGRVVIVGGGIGRPYLTTDTAAVSLALELDCQAVLKATKVDGVYDKDPATNSDAHRLETVSFQEAVANDAIKVMDKAALGLALEHSLPIVVFDCMQAGNLLKVVEKSPIGTTIS